MRRRSSAASPKSTAASTRSISSRCFLRCAALPPRTARASTTFPIWCPSIAAGVSASRPSGSTMRSRSGASTASGELAESAAVSRHAKNEELMSAGVTLIDPGTTYVDIDVDVGSDTVIHPNVYLEGRTKIGPGMRDTRGDADRRLVDRSRGRHSQLLRHPGGLDRGACGCWTVRPRAPRVDDRRGSPYRQLRRDEEDVMGRREGQSPGVSRRRDDRQKVNIGAGTITCNYDGERKHKTTIEDDASSAVIRNWSLP